LFSQQVLVALETGQGVIYAPASGWDRVYLLWTFRNFRSLPQNVLSPRQQQLIGSLYRKVSNGYAHELHDAVVVGMVEGFRPSSLATHPTSVKPKKLVADLLGKKSVSVPATAVLVVTIAILAWHQVGAQPVADSTSTQIVAATRPTDEPSAITKDVMAKDLGPDPASNPIAALPSATPIAGTNGKPGTATVHLGTPAPAVQPSKALPTGSGTQLPTAHTLATMETTARQMPGTSGVSRKRDPRDGRVSTHLPVAVAPSIYEAAVDQPRMQISGRPRKLVYPICPETRVRGKVSLQAVVGYDGAVNRVRVLTGDRALAAAAVEAVRQWRYEPFSGAAPRLERETNITISFISNEVVAVSFPSPAPLSR